MDPTAVATSSPGRRVLRVLWITLWLNVANFALKLLVALRSGNLTVLSDAFHGILDAANNIVGIFVMGQSWRPPDAAHPYGHRKFEALASLAVGGLMALTSWEVLKTIVHRIVAHAGEPSVRVTPAWLTMVGVGLALNIFITIYEGRRGRALRSTFLLADAAHTKTDVCVTLMSISSLVLAPRWPWLDGVLSFLVVGVILRTGWKVVRENVQLLTDTVRLDPEPIRKLVEAVKGVENCHAVRTHGMPDDVHLDLHIVVRPDITADRTHEIESAVRETLCAAFPDIHEVAIH
ncbi:MAG: cation diffusion facilitator family transporter, partial [bacterium]|nr:cation diffusion facilitator family transporter [bacterium]